MGTLILCWQNASKTDCGGGKRDRTADLLHAMQALSQLSYTPTFLVHAQAAKACAVEVGRII